MARRIIPVITRFRLNICEPYIIKYPIPDFDTRNSPVITPTNISDMFTLHVLIIVLKLLGKINFINICHLVAFKLFRNFILFLSVSLKA